MILCDDSGQDCVEVVLQAAPTATLISQDSVISLVTLSLSILAVGIVIRYIRRAIGG